MLRLALSIALLATPALSRDLAGEFQELFVKIECAGSEVSAETWGEITKEPYLHCARAAKAMVFTMDQAYRMRSSCPHPLTYTRFVQMAFDCSAEFRGVAGASASQVHSGFVERFNEKYSPASVHYCSVIEQEAKK